MPMPVLSSDIERRLDTAVRLAVRPSSDPRVRQALEYLIGVSHHSNIASYFQTVQDPLTFLPPPVRAFDISGRRVTVTSAPSYALMLNAEGIVLRVSGDSVTLPWNPGPSIYSPGEGERPSESILYNAATLLQRIYKIVEREVAGRYTLPRDNGRDMFESYVYNGLERALGERLSRP